MAKLKRNIIQLVEDPKANEIKLQTYLTPHFISFENCIRSNGFNR